MALSNLRGVIPAHLTPFLDDYSLDEVELTRHIRTLAAINGVNGIISNGHAGEVTSLSTKEYTRVLEIAKKETAGNIPIISGVLADTPDSAITQGKLAQQAGADGLLLFPPNLFNLGATCSWEIPYRFVASVADHVDLPIILFQFSLESRCAYTTETLVRLVENIPNIVAIKEGTNDLQRYEENFRALRMCSNHVSILCTNNTKLLPSLAIGGDGIISGSGSVIANLLVELWNAIETNNLFQAREVYAQMFPVMQVFYASPLLNMHSRMKVALKLMGLQNSAVSRPPLLPIDPEEQERIAVALRKSGLL